MTPPDLAAVERENEALRAEWTPTNRDKAAEPRGKGFWCGACDGDLVLAGAKCGRCGRRSPSRRAKKPSIFKEPTP